MTLEADPPQPDGGTAADRNVERLLRHADAPPQPRADFAGALAAAMQQEANWVAGRAARRSRGLRWVFLLTLLAVAAGLVWLRGRSWRAPEVPVPGSSRGDAGATVTPPQSPATTPSGEASPRSSSAAPAATTASWIDQAYPGLTPVRRPAAAAAEVVTAPTRLATGAHERRRVTLEDGSVLYMDTGTSVELPGERVAVLEHGGVYIECAPRPVGGKPFELRVGDRRVQALGTRIGATRDAAGESSLLVTQGHVEVTATAAPGSPPILVEAGQQLVLAAAAGVTPAAAEPAPPLADALAWLEPLLAAAELPRVSSSRAGAGLTVRDDDGEERHLPLRRLHVDVHVEDGFARTTVVQTYFNESSTASEGTFHFPLPADASISRLAMYVGGQLMEGGMVERDDGRNVFETIRHERRDPALLEWVDGNVFKMRVFPLEPRQEKVILIGYTQRLERRGSTERYIFPAGHSQRAGLWTFAARVVRGDVQVWRCASHDLAASVDGADLLIENRATEGDQDRDLELEIKPQEAIAGANALRMARSEEATYLMLRAPVELDAVPAKQPRHWVILFEAAFSRNPVLARAQCDVARALLEHAEHDDTFAVLVAAGRTHGFRAEPVPATRENVAAALAFLDATHLVGACNLGAAFASAAEVLARAPAGKRPTLVHLGGGVATLGETDPGKLAALLPESCEYAGVAVGRRWSRQLMDAAARRTDGFHCQISPEASNPWSALEVVSQIDTPRLTEVTVTGAPAAGGDPVSFLPLAATVFTGEELAAIARIPSGAELPARVTVRARAGSAPWEVTWEVPADLGSAPEAGYLPRTWARLEIDRLVSEDREGNRERIVALSKESYVLSPFTSLLVLENDAMYRQFGVDSGRRDHWAMYPAPLQIPVVHEPVGGTSPASSGAASPPAAQGIRVRIDAVLRTLVATKHPNFELATFEDGGGFGISIADEESNFLESLGVDWRGLGDEPVVAPADPDFDDFLVGIPTAPRPFQPGKEPRTGLFFDDEMDDDLRARVERLFDESLRPDQVMTGSGGLTLEYAILDDAQLARLRHPGGRQPANFWAPDYQDSSGTFSAGFDYGSSTRYGGSTESAGWSTKEVDALFAEAGRREVLARGTPETMVAESRVGSHQMQLEALAAYQSGRAAYDAGDYETARAQLTKFTDIVQWSAFDLRVDDLLEPARLLAELAERRSAERGEVAEAARRRTEEGSVRAGERREARHRARQVRELYVQGIEELSSGRFARSESAAREILRLDPTDQLAERLRADSVMLQHVRSDRELLDSHIRRWRECLCDMQQAKIPWHDLIVWPEDRDWTRFLASSPGRDTGAWEDDATWPAADRVARPGMEVRTQAQRAIHSRLANMRITVEFEEQTLDEVIAFIGDIADVNIVLDVETAKSVAARGERVNLSVEDVALSTTLETLCGLHDLTMVMRDDALLVISSSPQGGSTALRGAGEVALLADTLVYRVPSLVGAGAGQPFYTDLTAHCPGLATTRADVLATLEAEVPELAPRQGAIDDAARVRVDAARAAQGWRSLPLRDGALVFDGTGRFARRQQVGIGFAEEVRCDGQELLHLYRELGLGAQRRVSPFHRAPLLDLVPWLLPSIEDLARGADVTCDAAGVVTVTPHDQDADARLELRFDAVGALVERRWVARRSGETLRAESYDVAMGRVTWQNRLGEQTDEVIATGAAEAPDLASDLTGLVVLPMPARTPAKVSHTESEGVKGPEPAVMALVAALWGESDAAGVRRVVGNRFWQRGEDRIGFHVLLAACGENPGAQPLQVTGIGASRPDSTRAPLAARFPDSAAAAYLDSLAGRAAAGALEVAPALRMLATVRRAWVTLDPGQYPRSAPVKEAAAAIVDALRVAPAELRLSLLVGARCSGDRPLCSLLAEQAGTIAPLLRDHYDDRYQLATLLEAAGHHSAAAERFELLYRDACQHVAAPPVDHWFANALSITGRWRVVLQERAAALASEGRQDDVPALALQAVQLGDGELAGQLLAQVVAKAGESGLELRRGLLTCALMMEDWQLALQHLDVLLLDERFGSQPAAQRMAAEVAGLAQSPALRAHFLEVALQLELAQQSGEIDADWATERLGELLGALREVAALGEGAPPAGLSARIVRAADRWLQLEAEPTRACLRAAEALELAGFPELADAYLLSPVDLEPGASAPWHAIGLHHAARSQHERAAAAHAQAFAAEPTNPEHLWNQAESLAHLGRGEEAKKVYQRIIEGKWQERFGQLQQRARAAMK